MYRLAIVTSHPVQYQAPFFRKLSQSSDLEIVVYYGSSHSLGSHHDDEFGVRVNWGRDLVEGYEARIAGPFGAGGIPSTGISSMKHSTIVAEFLEKSFDAVMIHSYATPLAMISYAGALLAGIPILLHTESEMIRERSNIIRVIKRILLGVLFRNTAAFLAIGTENHRLYRHFGVPSDKIFHTPYSVDNDFFLSGKSRWIEQRDELKSALDLPPDLPIIVFSGKLIPRKRPSDLLMAYREVVTAGNPAALLYIGDGELRTQLESEARRRSLRHVRFLGFQSQVEIGKYYSLGDIFVLPSRFETWGLVVNEAMLFSMPVVVSNHVGAGSDLVINGETGFTFPAGETSRLAELLELLIRDEELRLSLGARALELVREWNYDQCLKGVLNALESVHSTA